MRILLVEDDAMLADALATALGQRDVVIDWARDAAEARLALVDHDYAAVLLDLGLPSGSGLAVLASMRARYDTTPVIIMTARDRLTDRIEGLDAGADDYLVKPFPVDELQARLRAVLRRSLGRVAPVLRCGDVVVDPASRAVSSSGVPVALSTHEYRTLLALMEKPGKALSRTALEDAVYGSDSVIESNTVAVYVHQLRRKLGEDLIETVHGYGYRMRA
ncbi:MAG: response regulator transcription factor [Pigmentiphaga sp.]|uniref:response regulator transcription factor n=1 Tax=Pigmentiphaga sp. TaxID=1977564 RepID=UPI0029AB3B1A|nr:response regulator transcription factor [Pigmentiphaga sp.]MDX3904795.1 response regulator transcription factor [Pigmentiphaga sp.]